MNSSGNTSQSSMGKPQFRLNQRNGSQQYSPQINNANPYGSNQLHSNQMQNREPLNRRAMTTPATMSREIRDLDDDYKGYEAPPSPSDTESQIESMQREIAELK